MKIKTEFLLLSVVIGGISSIVVTFFYLLQKYTFVSLPQLGKVCSEVALQIDYSSFHFFGRFLGTGGIVLGILFLIKTFFSLIKIRQKIVNFRFTTSKHHFPIILNLAKKYKVPLTKITVIENKKTLAMTYGLFNPKIIVSSGLIQSLSLSEVEAVFLHELHHLRRFHPFLFLIGEVSKVVFSFFPILVELFEYCKQHLEMEADTFACSVQKTTTHLESALCKVHAQHSHNIFPAFAETAFTYRVIALHTDSKPTLFSVKSILTSGIMIVLWMLLLITPVSINAQQQPESRDYFDCSDQSHSQCMTYCQPGLFSQEINQSKS